jgi:hypothetical protein
MNAAQVIVATFVRNSFQENHTITQNTLSYIMSDITYLDSTGPSVKERAKALHDHAGLFEMIAKFPQAGVHERFLREWALTEAYVESKVFQCRRSVQSFLESTLESGESDPNEDEYAKAMNPLVESLLLHGMCSCCI